MAKEKELQSEMAHARQSEGINVIFDQHSPALTRSHSRSNNGSSLAAVSSRGCDSHQRRRYRSSSSSSSSGSSSTHSRSRSHPRCHRLSSRCRCQSHRRYGRGRYRCSPPRRYRARCQSDSCSPSPDRYSHHRHYRSRSRSSSYESRRRNKRTIGRLSRRLSCSPRRTYRSRANSPPPGCALLLSLNDKRELLQAAKINAMKTLGTENLELPESVKPIVLGKTESKWESPDPERRVRHDRKKNPSQGDEMESDDMPSPKMSPKGKTISFSINNTMAKPTVATPSCVKVTARVDSYESRKPYGHWVPVNSRQKANTRKHTHSASR